ncbi:MAG: hypothetical protein PF961_13285 [Planctomycetota bacterium]|jgi:hypothetical protein|nr:hypothetical protein [Planctomycetota bacterium]
MRYRDASHIDLRMFWARRAELGQVYVWLGFLAVFAAWWSGSQGLGAAWTVLIVSAVAWFVAWFQVVGGLWRSTLVAAMLVSSLQVAKLSCDCCLVGMAP